MWNYKCKSFYFRRQCKFADIFDREARMVEEPYCNAILARPAHFQFLYGHIKLHNFRQFFIEEIFVGLAGQAKMSLRICTNTYKRFTTLVFDATERSYILRFLKSYLISLSVISTFNYHNIPSNNFIFSNCLIHREAVHFRLGATVDQ